MDYKIIMKRYKEGTATEEEKRQIEEELEKFQELETYLSEALDEELLQEENDQEEYREREVLETKKIRTSVNKKLFQMGVLSALVIVLLYVGIFHGMSSLVDKFYYQPNKESVGNLDYDSSFDLYAINALNSPGVSTSTVWVDTHGFGAYELYYTLRDGFTGETSNIHKRLQRGEVVYTQSDPIYGRNFFQSIRLPNDEAYLAQRKNAVVAHLEALNGVTYVSLEVTFTKNLTMEELYALEEKYEDLDFQWAGIVTGETLETTKEFIGIPLLNSHARSSIMGDEKVLNTYPGLFLKDWLVHPVGRSAHEKPLVAEGYEVHYKSLLDYLIQREEAVRVFEYREEKTLFYEEARAYAEDKGVETYGVVIYGEVEDLLLLGGDDLVKSLEFHGALVSRSNLK